MVKAIIHFFLVSTQVSGITHLRFPVVLGWMQKSPREPEKSPSLKLHQTFCLHEKGLFCQTSIWEEQKMFHWKVLISRTQVKIYLNLK